MRLKAWSERSTPLVAFGLVVAVLSGLAVLGTATKYGYGFYTTTLGWRHAAYEALGELRVGMTVERVDALLGKPIIKNVNPESKVEQYAYRQRDHWVQVLSKDGVSVTAFVVVSCDEDFNPSFETTSKVSVIGTPKPGEPYEFETHGKATLNETRLAELTPMSLDYRVYADRSSTMVEWTVSSAATSNLAYAWGQAATCPALPGTDDFWRVHPKGDVRMSAGYGTEEGGTLSPEQAQEVNSYRAVAVVNAWAVCEQTCDPKQDPMKSFEFGVNPQRASMVRDENY